MMEVRGDRSLGPRQQVDPDQYLRVVAKRTDVIVVRGAKASVSGAAFSHEIICGEYRFAGPLISHFATLQRLNSTGCKTGHRDLLLGTAAPVADYNGVETVRHIREKLTDLYFESEKSFGCGLAAVYTGEQSPSGVFMPNSLYANIAKLQGVTAIWQGNHIAADITGELVCSLPGEIRWQNSGKVKPPET
jgi:aromatic ring hydroxylase